MQKTVVSPEPAAAPGGPYSQAVVAGDFVDDSAAMNGLFPEYFGEPAPVRTPLQIDLPKFGIEIDAVLLRADDA